MHQRSAAIEGRAHRTASAGGINPIPIKSLGPAAWGQSAHPNQKESSEQLGQGAVLLLGYPAKEVQEYDHM